MYCCSSHRKARKDKLNMEMMRAISFPSIARVEECLKRGADPKYDFINCF